MVHHSTQSDDYLWYLILRGKQRKKTKTHRNTRFLTIFNDRNNNDRQLLCKNLQRALYTPISQWHSFHGKTSGLTRLNKETKNSLSWPN